MHQGHIKVIKACIEYARKNQLLSVVQLVEIPNLKRVNTLEKRLEILEDLGADVVVIDSATASKYVNDNKGLKIVEDAEAFASEEYAIAIQKGNTELLEKVNASIEKMLADGTISDFAAKYAVAE